MNIWEWALNIQIFFITHFITHSAQQNASTKEDTLKNQADRIPQPVVVSQPLSSVTLEMAQRAQEQSSEGEGYI